MKTRFLALCALSMMAYAETGTPPDWTGYYMLARGRDAAGLNFINPDLNKTVIEHLQPWAKLKMEETNGIADDTGAVCLPAGILRAPGTPFSGNFVMLPSRDKVIMAFWEANTSRVRRIYLNRQHPRNLLPRWNGDSVGHWEGDTLVVDTIGFNDKSWLSAEMTPHTEETHLTERMRQIEHNNSTYIEVVGAVEDRHALTSAYTYSRYYKKQNQEAPEHICADDVTLWKQWRNEQLKRQYERAREVKQETDEEILAARTRGKSRDVGDLRHGPGSPAPRSRRSVSVDFQRNHSSRRTQERRISERDHSAAFGR